MTQSANLRESPPRELHIVFGSGGMPAVLTGIGTTLALNVAGVEQFTSIGGASGGSIPAAILSCGLPPAAYLALILSTDFWSMLEGRRNLISIAWALLNKYRHGPHGRPERGIWTINAMRVLLDDVVPVWPPKLWLVAACDDGQLLFTANGAFKYDLHNSCEQIAKMPPSVGTAISASCAVPGLVDAVIFQNEKLVDGAFSQDGDVPAEVAWRHFGDADKLVLAVDVGEEPLKKNRILRAAWKLCGAQDREMYRVRPLPRPGLAFIDPRPEVFHSLKLRLSREERWLAIICGFLSASETLQAHYLPSFPARARLTAFCTAFAEFVTLARSGRSVERSIEKFLRDNSCFS